LTRLPFSLRLFIALAFFLIFSLAGVAWLAVRAARSELRDAQIARLKAVGALLVQQHGDIFLKASEPIAESETIAREAGRAAGVRVTLISTDGKVIGETNEDPSRLNNHYNRPEVQRALAGQIAATNRFSDTEGLLLQYVAIPVERDGRIIGILRVAEPAGSIEPALAQIKRNYWAGGLLALLLAGCLSAWMGRRISRPAEALRKTAERFADGDFTRRAFVDESFEFSALAITLNQMAAELERRFKELTRERNEREAILSSMREGVLAVDLDERIIMLNAAAEELLNVKAQAVVGRLVQEALRHAELQKFLTRARHNEAMTAENCQLQWDGERRLQAQWAPLRDEAGAECGVLLVLNDVTRLHKLENLRRDFVANVSHELRTPITSIKGFIETLQHGALHDTEHAEKFLAIMARQADRLNAIIEDLLALSRIEREAEAPQIDMKSCELRLLLENVAQHFAERAEAKSIALSIDCPAGLHVRGRDRLLEQAIGNLIDNAVKYSPAGRPVRMQAQARNGDILIHVIDEGPGIPAQHLPRLFERFYRVDAARSREEGGTGLGLAIVKHIVQTHGGRVSVQSAPESGSTFTIQLPREIS
jgi:two-component system, OmpR family, phosphate regulon sensor histidine kinase PhoR